MPGVLIRGGGDTKDECTEERSCKNTARSQGKETQKKLNLPAP